MARKIVITSGKGGVGKTTIAVRLGLCLAARGDRVVLADADVGLNNADVICGVENSVQFDLSDVIEGRCRAMQALVRHPESANFFILASGSPSRLISPQAMRLCWTACAALRLCAHRFPRGHRQRVPPRRGVRGRGARRHHAAHLFAARRG